MDFPQRLAELRKRKGLTQRQLAEAIGVHLSQVRRYEGGLSQPTLEVLKSMAQSLEVSADMLLFGAAERGLDEELRLQFEEVSRFEAEDKKLVRNVLDGLILRHQAKRLAI
jgi:transcriptional regulator with XRE-family HTH domain